MAIGTILADGEPRGLGFALATKQGVQGRVALTANHVTCNPKDRPYDKSALKFKLHTDGSEIPIDDVKRDEAGDLDVAALYLCDDVPGALAVGEAVKAERWELRAGPLQTDPYLIGSVDFPLRPYKNHKKHQTSVMQLGVQRMGGYKGYSGGPVVQSSTGAVIGVLIEEQFLRLPSSLSSLNQSREAAEILYAIPIQDVLERFGLDPKRAPYHRSFPPPSKYLFGRDELLKELKQRLLEPGQGSVTVLLQTPGVGKTELAVHLANSAEVKEKFGQRILWTALGRKPDIRALLGEWAHEIPKIRKEDLTNLHGDLANLHSDWKRRERIQRELEHGSEPWLLIVDDVWEMKHASDFLYSASRNSNRWTINTTRKPSIAREFDQEAHKVVEALDDRDGLALLEREARLPIEKADARRDALELVIAVDGLPQALVIMGRYLRKMVQPGKENSIYKATEDLKDIKKRLTETLSETGPGRPEDAPREHKDE